jgi:LuxR family maltose regulon positive regulatory protein
MITKELPLVTARRLHDPTSAEPIPLDSPAWFAWVADDQHRRFRFEHPYGTFTARKERKQRGSWYWVAYRQVRRRLLKVYLGKSETLTRSRLLAAAMTLTERSAGHQLVERDPVYS